MLPFFLRSLVEMRLLQSARIGSPPKKEIYAKCWPKKEDERDLFVLLPTKTFVGFYVIARG
jgi:hypothetical protein